MLLAWMVAMAFWAAAFVVGGGPWWLIAIVAETGAIVGLISDRFAA